MGELRIVDWVAHEKFTEGESTGTLTRKWGVQHYDIFKQEVLRKKLRVGGDDHHEKYIPIFSDGVAMVMTWREWGGYLAEIWGAHEGVEYSYMDFYMTVNMPPIP